MGFSWEAHKRSGTNQKKFLILDFLSTWKRVLNKKNKGNWVNNQGYKREFAETTRLTVGSFVLKLNNDNKFWRKLFIIKKKKIKTIYLESWWSAVYAN